MTEKLLEQLNDDLQIMIDDFFDRISLQIRKEAGVVKSKHLRSVKVDYPQFDPKVIDEIFRKSIVDSFDMTYWLNLFLAKE